MDQKKGDKWIGILKKNKKRGAGLRGVNRPVSGWRFELIDNRRDHPPDGPCDVPFKGAAVKPYCIESLGVRFWEKRDMDSTVRLCLPGRSKEPQWEKIRVGKTKQLTTVLVSPLVSGEDVGMLTRRRRRGEWSRGGCASLAIPSHRDNMHGSIQTCHIEHAK